MLAELVLGNSRARKLADVPIILNCVVPFLADTAFEARISQVSTVLSAALDHDPERFQDQVIEYIEASSSKAYSLDDLLRLERLRKLVPKLETNVDARLLEIIQAEVISYWQDDPEFELSQGGVLDDLYPGDEDFATEEALNYVTSSLDDFGISWEVADEIVRSLRIADMLYENLTSKATSYGREGGPLGPDHGGGQDDEIIDLFDRD